MYTIKTKTTAAKVMILMSQLIFLGCVPLIFHLGTPRTVQLVIWVELIVTFARLNSMMFFWLPRGIGWPEAIGNSIAFGLYFIGFPLLSVWGSDNTIMLSLGSILFILGATLNTTSELLRKAFRDKQPNKGKLYTGGLFKYAIHINYFGDVVWVLGFALTTTNYLALLIPFLLLLMFMFSYIPTADRHLQQHYGADFVAYQQSTKELIPFIW